MEREAEKAFLKAFEEHSDALLRHCYFKTSNRELAKDVVQEAFCRTWSYVAAGKKIDNMRAFLYRVAGNVIIDEMRKRKSFSLDALEEEGFTPADTSAPHSEDIAAGKEALTVLQKLEEPYRSAVTLRYVEGLQPKEIVALLQESENVVSVRIHRGIKKLRDLYEGNV